MKIYFESINRVITRKLPTTGNFTTFLASVDQEVTSVLLAKKFALLARKSENGSQVSQE
jgi:hypothetical protein